MDIKTYLPYYFGWLFSAKIEKLEIIAEINSLPFLCGDCIYRNFRNEDSNTGGMYYEADTMPMEGEDCWDFRLLLRTQYDMTETESHIFKKLSDYNGRIKDVRMETNMSFLFLLKRGFDVFGLIDKNLAYNYLNFQYHPADELVMEFMLAKKHSTIEKHLYL